MAPVEQVTVYPTAYWWRGRFSIVFACKRVLAGAVDMRQICICAVTPVGIYIRRSGIALVGKPWVVLLMERRQLPLIEVISSFVIGGTCL